MSNENEKNQSGMVDAVKDGFENMMDAVGNLFGEDNKTENKSTNQAGMNNLSKDDAEIASALTDIAKNAIANNNKQ